MNLHWIDWLIFVSILCGLIWFALVCRKYNRSVADFLAANRCAGRYLLTMAEGAASVGAVSFVAYFEQYFQAGFGPLWWLFLIMPMGLVLSLSGWVVYRFRETRALTMAQFFEMRYSRKFRVFAGCLTWISGILNYGLLPAIGARFVVYFFGLPQYVVSVGLLDLNLTLAAVMFAMLALALFFTFTGGQISVMITDFLQGTMFNFVFVGITIFLLCKFDWSHIMETLIAHAPEGQSMVNPFKQGNVPDFNAAFFLMQAFLMVYTYKAFQGKQGYNTSAKSPHEAKMANVLGGWRIAITWLLYMIAPICVFVMLHSPQFAETAASVNEALQNIGDSQIRTQMTTPVALTQLLPVGMIGLLAATIISAALSSDDTYLLSWGSIFVQDILLVLRKKPLSKEEHMVWLRRSIFGVAAFVFFFGLLFPLKDFIIMWWVITGAIYMGGAGVAIIGGLYWKRGTTIGAWGGMITGSSLATAGVLLRNLIWPLVLPGLKETYTNSVWLQNLPEQFPLNGMQLSFYSALAAITVYVVLSLLTKPSPGFSMDRLLHRGEFSLDDEHRNVVQKTGRVWKAIGVGPEFTRGDKVIYLFKIMWVWIWGGSFIIGCAVNLTRDVSDEAWIAFWTWAVGIMLVMAVITTIWFLWGGIRDLNTLFCMLKTKQRDETDDGRVESAEDVQ
jgi:solute:Na+ symporter, SSS family